MKHCILLIACLAWLSVPGLAQTTPVTPAPAALSDAAKSAVQDAITDAKADLELKKSNAEGALKAKADAEKARDDKDAAVKELKAAADKDPVGSGKPTPLEKYNTAADELKVLQTKADEKARAAETAVKAKIAAEDKLNGLTGTGAASQNPLTLGNDRIYQASLASLTKIFVVAVLLENGLALLFNWSVFLTYFNRRAMRPVVMFLAAFILVWGFNLDIVAQLIAIYNATPSGDATVTGFASIFSELISASVLAGGSAGVFNIMAALGFRSAHERDSAPSPGAEHAWVSVRLTGLQAAGENAKLNDAANVSVNIEEISDTSKITTPLPLATAGTIALKSPKFFELFSALTGRFPPVAGYLVKADSYYKIEVIVKTKNGVKELLDGKGFYKFAPRAIVDLEVPYAEAANSEGPKVDG